MNAATGLFLDRGYTCTTIKDVAQAAGVAEMTVYTAIRDKRGMLEAVISKAIGGSDFVPIAEGFAELEHLPTQHHKLGAWVELTCEILARTSPIHAVIRGAAGQGTVRRTTPANTAQTHDSTRTAVSSGRSCPEPSGGV